jgi:hypothetical protein
VRDKNQLLRDEFSDLFLLFFFFFFFIFYFWMAVAVAVESKARIIRGILGKEMMEKCYRECLAMSPGFAYPVAMIPSGVPTFWPWRFSCITRSMKGTSDARTCSMCRFKTSAGRNYYLTVAVDSVLTSVFSYKRCPNLYAQIMLKGRACDDLKRMLKDPPIVASVQALSGLCERRVRLGAKRGADVGSSQG